MISLKINNIIKLKMFKIHTQYLLNCYITNSNLYKLTFLYFFYANHIINKFNFYYQSASFKLIGNLKKLKFFKNDYINSFVFYNSISNYKLDNALKVTNISSYDSKFIFLYYNCFIKNTKLGISKYFTSFYQNNLFFIRFFIIKYLKSFIKDKNIYLSLQKNHINILEKRVLYKTLLKKTKYLKFLKEINFKIKTFLNLILISLFSKDVVLFKNGIKNILEKLHFKKHRKFLYSLKILLKTLSKVFFYKFKCLGLYVKVKGKIGLGGSSKKKKFIFKLGSFSFTKKSQKLNYVKDSIRTYSGVLGFEMYLTYK